jgi:hypothetical protein
LRLNKKIFFLLIIILSLFISCGDKKTNSEGESSHIDFEDPNVVIQEAKNILGSNLKFAYKGKFDNDSVIEIAAGTEIQSAKEWGIKFFLLKMHDNQLKITYQTPLENGSFNQCLIQKIKFPMFDYELIYYNSQDYFLGSSGGEVYSYLINYNETKPYYAHLINEPGSQVSLYLSDNIDIPQVKSFFVSNFKRDYSSINIINKDIVLKY